MALIEPSGDVLAELEALENAVPGVRAEFIEGQFYVNRPANLHQFTINLVIRHLEAEHLEPGEIALSEVRVQVGDGWIIPDVVVVARDWIYSPDPIPVKELMLAAEVLSPSTEPVDRGPKRRVFQEAQSDYWLVEQADVLNIIEKFGYGGGRFC